MNEKLIKIRGARTHNLKNINLEIPRDKIVEITGLSPAISIDQKSRSQNPRSTVATITEIYDYLRVLYARVGHPFCPVCGTEIKKLSNEEIVNFTKNKIAEIKKQSKDSDEVVEIYAPVVRGRKGEYYQMLYDLLDKGYREILLDGVRKKLRERIVMAKTTKHDIDVLVDEISVKELTFKAEKELVKNSTKKGNAKILGAVKKAVGDSANERLSEAVER